MASKSSKGAARKNSGATAVDQELLEQAAREDTEGQREPASTVRSTNTGADEDDEDDEETQAERCERLDRERRALRSSPSGDSLRARLLALLGGNQYAKIDEGPGVSHETALFRYAAATTKAVAMALQGTERVCANEPFETEFSTEEAAYVLCGVSALLEEGPKLIEDIRYADPEVRS